MIRTEHASHWLMEAAGREEPAGSKSMEIDRHLPIADIWQEVTRAVGITHELLADRVAKYLRLPVANFGMAEPHATKLVPEKVARRYGIFPLRETDKHLVVATCDAPRMEVEQAIGFASGRTPLFEISTPNSVQKAIETGYSAARSIATLVERLDKATDDVRVLGDVHAGESDETPVIKLTNLILNDAVRQGASDIHIEPGLNGAVVRFRVDGVLRQNMQIPGSVLNRVVSRIKVLGGLDIADRHRPHDGSSRVEIAGRKYDLRISTVPTLGSEKAVIRILDPESSKTFDQTGIMAADARRIRSLLGHRDGIVIVTGPTGSGKTTTLYSILRELSTGEVNIMTVEDPIEYQLQGITQIQVQPRRGVTFASSLRAILRQDPDVIFIGELRDLETAEVAVQASMTGHLVLATLHTNDAVGVPKRLIDLGLDRSSIAATLRGVIAQRLIRRVCARCAQPIVGSLTEEEHRLSELHETRSVPRGGPSAGPLPTVRTIGCEACGHTGFRGRMPVQEVMMVTPQLSDLIASDAKVSEIQELAIQGGMRSLHGSAIDRVRAGETTLQEVDRVLGEVADDASRSVAVETPHVLLIDDDPLNRKVARSLLEKNGYRVSEAADGLSGMEHIASNEQYTLVVLDYDMPRLNGRDVLGRIRSSTATIGLPIVVLTGSVDSALEATLMDEGADDYIRKPIDPTRFLSRVKAVLRRAAL